MLFIGPFGTNVNEMLMKIHTFWSKKINLKVSSEKWRPFCLGVNALLMCYSSCIANTIAADVLATQRAAIILTFSPKVIQFKHTQYHIVLIVLTANMYASYLDILFTTPERFINGKVFCLFQRVRKGVLHTDDWGAWPPTSLIHIDLLVQVAAYQEMSSMIVNQMHI